MRRSNARDHERGSASVEFLGLGLVLLLPCLYLALAVLSLQAGLLGVESAARSAARVVAETPAAALEAHGGRGLENTVRVQVGLALDNHGLDAHRARIATRCAPDPRCAEAATNVVVEVGYPVALPWVPPGVEGFASIEVAATAAFPRAEYAAREPEASPQHEDDADARP